jgi:hypothetical protein
MKNLSNRKEREENRRETLCVLCGKIFFHQSVAVLQPLISKTDNLFARHP